MSTDIKDSNPTKISINISKGGIPKHPVKSSYISVSGLDSDGHNHDKHNNPIQAVCLQDIEKLNELKSEGYALYPGATGENLSVANLHVNSLPLGTVLEFPSGLALELSKVRKPCYVLDSIDIKLKEDIIGRCGMYAKVLKEGLVEIGEPIEIKEVSPCAS